MREWVEDVKSFETVGWRGYLIIALLRTGKEEGEAEQRVVDICAVAVDCSFGFQGGRRPGSEK